MIKLKERPDHSAEKLVLNYAIIYGLLSCYSYVRLISSVRGDSRIETRDGLVPDVSTWEDRCEHQVGQKSLHDAHRLLHSGCIWFSFLLPSSVSELHSLSRWSVKCAETAGGNENAGVHCQIHEDCSRGSDQGFFAEAQPSPAKHRL